VNGATIENDELVIEFPKGEREEYVRKVVEIESRE
jgi:hypothetical protein